MQEGSDFVCEVESHRGRSSINLQTRRPQVLLKREHIEFLVEVWRKQRVHRDRTAPSAVPG